MNTASTPTRLSRATDILSTELDGELLLMNIDQGRYYALKGTARHVWNLLDQTRTLGEVCSALGQHYRSSPGKIDTDVTTFIGKLADQKLLVLS